MSLARNDMSGAVAKFCLGLEAHRRTQEGRVRTAREFLAHFFPYDEKGAEDRIFRHLPRDVRGPILTTWGVRAQKSALRDPDEKVRSVVHDALVAGDLDAAGFEDALSSDLVVRWVDLPEWWTFWRGGKIAKYSILKALESGYELGLFDAEWFLAAIVSKDGKTRGTDVLSEGLSKADLIEWVRMIYQSGDGSPKGIVGALGWDQVVAKTPDDVLISVLDAVATKVGLAENTKGPDGPKDKAKAPDAVDDKGVKIVNRTEPSKGDPARPLSMPAVPGPGDVKRPTEPSRPPMGAQGSSLMGAIDSWSIPPPETGKSLSDPVKLGDAQPRLPGVLIPTNTAAPMIAGPVNQELEGEAAANLFKDDEMIPISSSPWEEGGQEDEDTLAQAPGGTGKKEGKRPSSKAPARAKA